MGVQSVLAIHADNCYVSNGVGPETELNVIDEGEWNMK